MKNALVSCFILIVIGCNNQYKEKKQNVNGAETTEQVQPKEMTKVKKNMMIRETLSLMIPFIPGHIQILKVIVLE